ncbi:MAG: flagellar assembly protein FliW [Ruminococcus sp.]|jgi:flagellar assembly factor FliW|nr:flagellar assembly protein FliW [Ruminococcus sp.]
MILSTRDFGNVEIFEENIINFPEGVFSFENNTEFTILSPLGEDKYPMWLQSTQNGNLCFIVYDPFEIAADFEPDEEQLERELDIGEDTNVLFLSIAVIPEDHRKTTVNLKSPIVINLDTKTGKQIVFEADYPVRFPIFAETGDE